MTGRIQLHAPDGVAEVVEGDDLTTLLLDVVGPEGLHDGDVVLITSKVVSKAEGRRRSGDRADAVAGETVRVVARRGPTSIVRNHLGLTMAAAGIDASNVSAGDHLLLPQDPDATARAVRTALAERAGVNVAVVVTDTAGRAWRTGQTDIAIGAAGLLVLEEYAGREDAHGNELAVTAPAVADELAGAGELASGKLGGHPFVIVRGRADLVLPQDDHGTGAGALIREDGADMFGYGAREAVVHALAGTGGEVFGAPAGAEDLARAFDAVLSPGSSTTVDEAVVRVRLTTSSAQAWAETLVRLDALAFAFGWRRPATPDETSDTAEITFQPSSP